MSGSRYVERSAREVCAFFEDELGFVEISLPNTQEIVFERTVELRRNGEPAGETEYAIRAYTSVSRGSTRKAGEDAGRVVLIHVPTNAPAWKSKRAHRTKNFLSAMRNRCREAWRRAASMPRCPKCGSAMAVRWNKRDESEFFGCVHYPKCNGTRKVV